MNLEQKIDEIINEYNSASLEDNFGHRYNKMELWRFKGYVYTNDSNDSVSVRIHKLIQEADLNECLTSPYSYVRDYKKALWSKNERS